MRRLVLIAALLISTTAVAGETSSALRGSGAYGTAGCGLGSLAFGSQPGGIQIIAATLNGTGMQTFGITTGTSNCGSGVMASNGTRNFVEANREVLAKDMSRGQGETIGALTWMAGCSNSQAVGAALQSRYSTIIPSEKATSQEIADKLLETLKADKSLGCQI